MLHVIMSVAGFLVYTVIENVSLGARSRFKCALGVNIGFTAYCVTLGKLLKLFGMEIKVFIFIFLCLSSLVCKMGKIIVLIPKHYCAD